MKLAIITPVFNDWESLFELVKRLTEIEALKPYEISIFAVNDCSTNEIPEDKKGIFNNLEIIHIVRNLGHQKALTIGMCYVQKNFKPDAVVIMDADGEDRPEDISKLLTEWQQTPKKIVFARRAKRHESGAFKVFYQIYKKLFKSLTGEYINFGNFSIIPGDKLFKVLHLSEIWNNYAGGIMRSRLPYTGIMVTKGFRYFGESKMNFVSLVIHGLSAMSVYLEVLSVRIMLFQIAMAVILATALIIIALTVLLGDILVPDWAISLGFAIATIFIVNVFMSIMLTFMVLHYRSQKAFIPWYDAEKFIESVEKY